MRAVPWGARQRHAGLGDAAGEAATAEVAQELHRDRTDAGDEPDEVGVAGVEARDRQPGGVVGPSGGELDGVVTRIAVVGRQRVDGDARAAGGGVDERGGALVAEPRGEDRPVGDGDRQLGSADHRGVERAGEVMEVVGEPASGDHEVGPTGGPGGQLDERRGLHCVEPVGVVDGELRSVSGADGAEQLVELRHGCDDPARAGAQAVGLGAEPELPRLAVAGRGLDQGEAGLPGDRQARSAIGWGRHANR
jgi:hypothetical protein